MTGSTQRNPVSGTMEIFAVNSGIQKFWILNSAPQIPDSMAWNPESKTVLDSLTLGEMTPKKAK